MAGKIETKQVKALSKAMEYLRGYLIGREITEESPIETTAEEIAEMLVEFSTQLFATYAEVERSFKLQMFLKAVDEYEYIPKENN